MRIRILTGILFSILGTVAGADAVLSPFDPSVPPGSKPSGPRIPEHYWLVEVVMLDGSLGRWGHYLTQKDCEAAIPAHEARGAWLRWSLY